MTDKEREAYIESLYDVYPLSRKVVFDTFDKKKYGVTRTQQIILLALTVTKTLTMSQLASKINTSNEQATRAVAQLVDKGFIVRLPDPNNRRVIKIQLTDEAIDFVKNIKSEMREEFKTKFSVLTDDEMAEFCKATSTIVKTLKKISL